MEKNSDLKSNAPSSADKAKAADAKADRARELAAKKSLRNSERLAQIKSKDEKAKTDTPPFGDLISSLLTMTSPAQNLPAVTAPSTDSPIEASISAGIAISANQGQQVTPQPVPGAGNTGQSDFNADLLAALTPGIPAPSEDQSALMSQIESATSASTVNATSVAVPVVPADAATTPELSVNSGIDISDPRLIACGFNPLDMSKFKPQLNPVKTPPSSASNPAETTAALDDKTVSVSFVHAKPLPPIVVNSQPVQAVSTEPDILIASAGLNEPVQIAQAETLVANVNASSSEASDEAAQQAVLSGRSFDPVEFRIAQSFQRPVAQPQTPASPTPNASPQSAPVNVTATIHTPFQHAVNASIFGHANAGGNDLSSSFPTSLLPQAMEAQSDATSSLTVTPSTLPAVMGPLTSTAVQSSSAVQSHPAIQAVAAVIAKNAKEGGAQTLSMRLDPPDLGKLQVEMKYKKGDPLKVHVVLEKADTAQMFQRDAHALASTLKDAGLELDGSSLSFEFSGEGNFQQALNGNNGNASPGLKAVSASITDMPALESTPDIYTDIKTGLIHYNLKV